MISDSAEGPYPSQMLTNSDANIMLTLGVVSVLLLLCLVFVFSFCEYSLFSLSSGEKEKLKQTKSTEYHSVKLLLKDEQGALSAIVAGYFLSLLGLVLSLNLIFQLLLSEVFTQTFVFVVSIVVSFVLLIFVGESLASRIKKSNSKKMLLLYYFSPIVRFFSWVLFPIVWLMKKTTFIEKRLEYKCRRGISIDELSHTLQSSSLKDGEEKSILESIVTFGQISVEDIMKPRVEVVAVETHVSYSEVLRIIRESEYSRLPVYDGTIDNVIGILYVKDLLPHINEKEDYKWQKFIREPFYVPESKKIDDLLREFQQKRMHIAIVVDEFGGTSGIVTMEDILEVIFGDINDEHDIEQKLYSELDKHNYLFDGKLQLSDFFKMPKIDVEKFEDIETDADTVAGLILQLSGSIPKIGEEIEHRGYVFKIVSVDNRRIKKIKLRIPDKE